MNIRDDFKYIDPLLRIRTGRRDEYGHYKGCYYSGCKATLCGTQSRPESKGKQEWERQDLRTIGRENMGCKCGGYEVGSGSPVCTCMINPRCPTCIGHCVCELVKRPPKVYSKLNIISRPNWPEIYLSFAHALSKRSTCARASVGCVITSWDHNRVLAIGYNGNYRNGPNVCDSDEPGKCGCLHAEENAIIKLDFNDPVRKRLYTTTSACIMCAKRILNSGIDQVTYLETYRDRTGIDLLSKNGVEIVFHDTKIPGIDIKDSSNHTYLGTQETK